MVLAELAVDEHGQFPGHTNDTKCSLQPVLSKLWQSLSDEGMITKVSLLKLKIKLKLLLLKTLLIDIFRRK